MTGLREVILYVAASLWLHSPCGWAGPCRSDSLSCDNIWNTSTSGQDAGKHDKHPALPRRRPRSQSSWHTVQAGAPPVVLQQSLSILLK